MCALAAAGECGVNCGVDTQAAVEAVAGADGGFDEAEVVAVKKLLEQRWSNFFTQAGKPPARPPWTDHWGKRREGREREGRGRGEGGEGRPAERRKGKTKEGAKKRGEAKERKKEKMRGTGKTKGGIVKEYV